MITFSYAIDVIDVLKKTVWVSRIKLSQKQARRPFLMKVSSFKP